MRAPLFIVAAAVAALAGATNAASSSHPQVSSVQGIYTGTQAKEGAALYAAQCAMCHGQNLEGTFDTPSLRGKFIADWNGAPVSALFGYIGNVMPQFAPGSLSPDDEARIIAFLLHANGMPEGAAPLPADPEALKSMLLSPVPAR